MVPKFVAGGGRVKSFESSQGEKKRIQFTWRGSEEVPGEGTSKRFQVPGGGAI